VIPAVAAPALAPPLWGAALAGGGLTSLPAL
jgi:hypothetical protein